MRDQPWGGSPEDLTLETMRIDGLSYAKMTMFYMAFFGPSLALLTFPLNHNRLRDVCGLRIHNSFLTTITTIGSRVHLRNIASTA